MLTPNFNPQFLAGEDCLGAQLVQLDENQMANTLAEFVHGEVYEFLSVFWDHFVGNVMVLVVAQVLQVLLVDISLAEFSHDSYVLVVKSSFYLVIEKAPYKFVAFLLAPQKRKHLIYDVQFEVFLNVTTADRRLLFGVLFRHISLVLFLTSSFSLSILEFCLFYQFNFL